MQHRGVGARHRDQVLVPVSGRASKFPSLGRSAQEPCRPPPCTGLKEEPTRARREDEWPEGKWAAYQVKLDMGQFIYAPIDQDKVCKAPPEGMEPARAVAVDGFACWLRWRRCSRRAHW